ncbi:adenosine deaminase-like [Dermacentor andersoni]|uniref:adenosine deaminase-like n=1 Tax=Dermacentor andersoni TaxID=34620 RepID=UPI0024179288|nr:adenosine deaminase-like [Dermacentor andersoni]
MAVPFPRFKVMLHTHLDGHIRHTTIMEYAKKKKIDLGYANLQDCLKKTRPAKPSTLQNYLKEMPNYLRVIVGDRDALTRIAYEAAVDQANCGVIYSEMRLFAQMMSSTMSSLPKGSGPMTLNTTREVVDATLAGFKKAEDECGIKARLVLACFRDKPEWADEVVTLCQEYKGKGVVGMDVCGVFAPKQTEKEGEEILHPQVISAFKKAATLGVHRTAHAGEAGPPSNISRAIQELGTERIGHGYAAMRDGGEAFKLAISKNIHFEVCPNSSYLTGAVKTTEEHPMMACKKQNASFSMSTDDPTITHTDIDDEYWLALRLGLTPQDIIQTNHNAIKNCFLPPDEKESLRKWFDQLNGLA